MLRSGGGRNRQNDAFGQARVSVARVSESS